LQVTSYFQQLSIKFYTNQVVVLYVTALYPKMQSESLLKCNGIIVK